MMALIEERGRGRGGEHTGIVIHSLLSPVSVCRTFPLHHCHFVHSVFFPSSFSHTLTKTTPVTLRLCVRFYYTRAFIHSGSNTKPQPPLKMQMGSICGRLLSQSGRSC